VSARRGVARVLAPAKINPVLEVLERRADGFHELDMTMLAVDLCDQIEARVTQNGDVKLAIEGPAATSDIGTGPDNLAVRGARCVLDEARARGLVAADAGLDLRLSKQVPSRAGLGGGSSDAAAAAVAALSALDVELPANLVIAKLAEVGSDCAFFLAAGNTGHARCRGRGERVEALSHVADSWSFALLVPGLECPTAAVYRALEFPLRAPEGVTTVTADLFERSEDDARRTLFNRLERAALRAVPELQNWRAPLDREGASHFRLSGSGSAFYGAFRSTAHARESLDRLVAASVEAGLEVRGNWVVHPAGFGTRTLA